MNAFCFFLIKIFIKEKANKKPMHSRILLGRQTMPMHGKSLNHLMLLDQIQMKSSPKLYPTMGCQVITKRHLFYHYFTKVCLCLFYSMQCNAISIAIYCFCRIRNPMRSTAKESNPNCAGTRKASAQTKQCQPGNTHMKVCQFFKRNIQK